MNDVDSSSWPIPKAFPAKVGLYAEQLEHASNYIRQLIDDRTIAGAISMVARRGQIGYLNYQGWQDVENRVPMVEDALFRIYSMTKPIVCVATLMLYEQGEFLLHDPVRRFLPQFADLKVAVNDSAGESRLVSPSRDITIHDLLTQTGGLSYALAQEFGNTGLDSAAFLTAFCKEPLLGHPGEAWRYSSSNDVLGRLIEVVSRQPLDHFLDEKIFRPLGMNDTSFFVPPSKQHRLAAIYEHDADARIVRRTIEDRPYLQKPAFLSGGAGLVSSTSDYLRFCLMLLNGGSLHDQRIIRPKTVELMRQDHLPPGHPPIEPFKFGYGYGVSVVRNLAEKQGKSSVGEFGWGGAAFTNAWIDPQQQMVSMVMLQLKPSLVPMIDHRIKAFLSQAVIE